MDKPIRMPCMVICPIKAGRERALIRVYATAGPMASEEARLVVADISQGAPKIRAVMRTDPMMTESKANSEMAFLLSLHLSESASPSSPPLPAKPASLLMLATCKNAKIRPRLSKTVDEGPRAASSRVEDVHG